MNRSEIQVDDKTESDDRNPMNKSSHWLNQFAKNFTSQNGEDGIIEKVLEVIQVTDKWCVEFGSWDGKHCSNTYNLIHNKGYSAVLIEGDTSRYQDLLRTYERNRKIFPINAFVGFNDEDCLDALLKKTELPDDFDLLSIDIDGNDYHVWGKVNDYKPKIVIIEYNPTIPNPVEFVQSRNMRISQGSSLLSINNLAKIKGYELVAVTQTNAIFVDSKYFDLFGIRDNSVAAMRSDESLVTHIFCGYDGTVFIRGCGDLPWQRVSYRESRMQQLPKWLRESPGSKNKLRKKFARLYHKLRDKNIV
jgi:hypothetical protein